MTHDAPPWHDNPFGDDDSIAEPKTQDVPDKRDFRLGFTLEELTHPARISLSGPQLVALELILYHTVRRVAAQKWTHDREHEVFPKFSADGFARLGELMSIKSRAAYYHVENLIKAGFVRREGKRGNYRYFAYAVPPQKAECNLSAVGECRGSALASATPLHSPEPLNDPQVASRASEGQFPTCRSVSLSGSFYQSKDGNEVMETERSESLHHSGKNRSAWLEDYDEEDGRELSSVADATAEGVASNDVGHAVGVDSLHLTSGTAHHLTANGNDHGNGGDRATAVREEPSDLDDGAVAVDGDDNAEPEARRATQPAEPLGGPIPLFGGFEPSQDGWDRVVESYRDSFARRQG